MSTYTMQLFSMLGTWFAAIGTIAAVVVALWLARRTEKVRLDASVGVRTAFGSGRSEGGVFITVTNLGERPATIHSVSWGIGKPKRSTRSAIDKNALNQCPKKLEHGETANFFTPFSPPGESLLLKQLATNLQITTKKQVKALRVRIHTSVRYTKYVVPDESLLRKLQEVIESKAG